MKKQMTMLLVAMILVFNSIGVYAAENITILINDSLVISEVDPFIEDGTTYVPIRFVAENLGAEVNWIAESKTVEIIKEGIDKIVIDEPNIVNGRTFVPLRFVAENLNCTVDWDGDTKTVIIKEKDYVEVEPKDEVETEQKLIDKYTALSEKARDITEFTSYPVTEYYSWDQVPKGVDGYWINKIRFADIDDFPITVLGDDIYDIGIEDLDGTKVFTVTLRVMNREITMPLIYATKEKGLLVRRDVHINGVREDIVKIGYRDFVVKQKYTLPTREGFDIKDIEYFVFYGSNLDAIAIKNPYK